MLTDAALEGKIDRLAGLKENVIIGKLIPAATGLKRYRTIEIEPAEPLPRGIDDVGLLEGDELAAELGLDDGEGLGGFGPAFDTAELEEIGSGFGPSGGGFDDMAGTSKSPARAGSAVGLRSLAEANRCSHGRRRWRGGRRRRCCLRGGVAGAAPPGAPGDRAGAARAGRRRSTGYGSRCVADLHAGAGPHDAGPRGGGRRRGDRARRGCEPPARRLPRLDGARARARAARRTWPPSSRGSRTRPPCSATTTGAPPARRCAGRCWTPASGCSRTRPRELRPGLWVAGTADLRHRHVSCGAALRGVPEDAAVLLCTHDPDLFPRVPRRVALTVAGHLHGGQVNVPVLRRAVAPDALRRAVPARPRRRGRPPSLRLGRASAPRACRCACAGRPSFPSCGSEPPRPGLQLGDVRLCAGRWRAPSGPAAWLRHGVPPSLAGGVEGVVDPGDGTVAAGAGLDRGQLPVARGAGLGPGRIAGAASRPGRPSSRGRYSSARSSQPVHQTHSNVPASRMSSGPPGRRAGEGSRRRRSRAGRQGARRRSRRGRSRRRRRRAARGAVWNYSSRWTLAWCARPARWTP